MAIIWGRRTARPLIELAGCMSQIGNRIPDDLVYDVPETGDEIEQLGNQFLIMVDELREKSLLEKQIVATAKPAAPEAAGTGESLLAGRLRGLGLSTSSPS